MLRSYPCQPQNRYENVDKCWLKSDYRNDWKKYRIQVWWYQRGRQTPQIKERQTIRKKKGKRTNNDIQSITQKTKDLVTWTPLKTGSELNWLLTLHILITVVIFSIDFYFQISCSLKARFKGQNLVTVIKISNIITPDIKVSRGPSWS